MHQTPNANCSAFVKCTKTGGIALLFVLLAACGNGFNDKDIDAVKKGIKAEFARRELTVTEFSLSKDSAYQVSGTVNVQMETSMGLRNFLTSCVATMDKVSGSTHWKCDQIPSGR